MSARVGSACGKIILSGNTANRFGRRALAVPVDLQITATWNQNINQDERLETVWDQQKADGIWLRTVEKIAKLAEARIGPLTGTLTIENSLPLGRGMGSSTAIVIALARCFFGANCEEQALAIENIINPGHSGLDFAVIWNERPIIIQGNKHEFAELPTGLYRGFLVDTGLPSAPTSIIVQQLKQRLFADKSLLESVEIVGNCTERLLSGENPLTVFPDDFKALRNLGVVPSEVQLLIERIQESGGAAKSVRFGGADGGVGMLFVVHPQHEVLEKMVQCTPLSLFYNQSRGRFLISPHNTTQECAERLVANRNDSRVRSDIIHPR